jgi:D-alanyl-D-alanine carboxypeptidase
VSTAGLVVLALALACATACSSRGADAERQRSLEHLHSAGAPGVVMVVRDGSDEWSGAAGDAVLNPRRPMRADDSFRIASLTKTFVATLVLRLAADGRLALDDTVERHYPGLLRHGGRITLRQLLNHTSGLGRYDNERLYFQYLSDLQTSVKPRDLVAGADALPLLFKPGTGWEYTNTGYDALGLVIERVTAAPLDQTLAKRIFEPLRIRHTTFQRHRPRNLHHLAHGYTGKGSDLPFSDGQPRDVTGAPLHDTWASGAVISNAHDLASFYKALLGGKVLPPRFLGEMLRTVATPEPKERAGLGIFRYRLPCGYAWGHGGVTLGYQSRLLASKDGSHVFVIAKNEFSPDSSLDFERTARKLYCSSLRQDD